MSQQIQASAGDWHPDMARPYWSVIPPFEWYWWRPYPSTVPLQWWSAPAQTVTTDKTFADHIAIANEAREAGKRMRRYRRIR